MVEESLSARIAAAWVGAEIATFRRGAPRLDGAAHCLS
jgi:hypothetical protein